MKIVQINATCGLGSTGNICLSISRLLTENGVENYVLYTVGDCAEPTAVKVGDISAVRIAAARSRLTGNYGFTSKHITKQILYLLKKDVDAAQTIDTVKHGKWISVPHKKDRVCSICYCDEPYKFADEDSNVFDYCPHCGAKMDEVE